MFFFHSEPTDWETIPTLAHEPCTWCVCLARCGQVNSHVKCWCQHVSKVKDQSKTKLSGRLGPMGLFVSMDANLKLGHFDNVHHKLLLNYTINTQKNDFKNDMFPLIRWVLILLRHIFYLFHTPENHWILILVLLLRKYEKAGNPIRGFQKEETEIKSNVWQKTKTIIYYQN